MKTAFLVRDYVGRDCVMGRLIVDGKAFETLERPWVNNTRNKSCIPSDTYPCYFMPRSASGKYRNVYHVKGVLGRSGILVHNGNIVRHTKGCLLVGKRRGWLSKRRAVLNSKSAMRELVKTIGKEPFNLMIMGNQQCSMK